VSGRSIAARATRLARRARIATDPTTTSAIAMAPARSIHIIARSTRRARSRRRRGFTIGSGTFRSLTIAASVATAISAVGTSRSRAGPARIAAPAIAPRPPR